MKNSFHLPQLFYNQNLEFYEEESIPISKELKQKNEIQQHIYPKKNC